MTGRYRNGGVLALPPSARDPILKPRQQDVLDVVGHRDPAHDSRPEIDWRGCNQVFCQGNNLQVIVEMGILSTTLRSARNARMTLAILADPAQIVMLGISQENVRAQVPGLSGSLKPPCRARQVGEIQSWVDRDQNIGILGGKLDSRQRAHEGNTVKASQPADLVDKGPHSHQQELARITCGIVPQGVV
jgi:hypothetical protein